MAFLFLILSNGANLGSIGTVLNVSFFLVTRRVVLEFDLSQFANLASWSFTTKPPYKSNSFGGSGMS